MTEDVTPPAAAEERNPLGWVLLGVIFFFMISMSVFASFVPSKKGAAKPPAPDAPEEMQLQLEVSMRRRFDRMVTGPEAGELEERATSMLDEPIAGLVTKSHTDLEAARDYGAMRTEQGRDVPDQSLAPLRNSKLLADQTLAKIYAAKSLTKVDAWALSQKLPDEPFVYRLAKVQAQEKAGNKKIRAESFSGTMFLSLAAGMFLGLGLVFGSLLCWGLLFSAVAKGNLKPLGTPMGPISLADADRLALRAAQILTLFLVLEYVTANLHLGNAQLVVAGIGMLAALPIIAKSSIQGKTISLSSAGLSLRSFWRHVAWGIGGFFVELPLTMVMAAIGLLIFSALPEPTHPATEEILNAKNLLSILPILFFGSITAPIWEEFVFRGLIFPALYRVLGRVTFAAVLTGFIFAMIHPQGIVLWMALATVGTMGCALTYQTRSLIPTIVMHMLHNSAIFVAILLAMGYAKV